MVPDGHCCKCFKTTVGRLSALFAPHVHRDGGCSWPRVAWRAAKRNVLAAGAIRWACVSGPLGALRAQLSEYRWYFPEVDNWRVPGGETNFTLDPRAPIASFVQWVCAQTRLVLWDRAAAHYCGRGFEGVPDS